MAYVVVEPTVQALQLLVSGSMLKDENFTVLEIS